MWHNVHASLTAPAGVQAAAGTVHAAAGTVHAAAAARASRTHLLGRIMEVDEMQAEDDNSRKCNASVLESCVGQRGDAELDDALA